MTRGPWTLTTDPVAPGTWYLIPITHQNGLPFVITEREPASLHLYAPAPLRLYAPASLRPRAPYGVTVTTVPAAEGIWMNPGIVMLTVVAPAVRGRNATPPVATLVGV